MKLAGWPTRSMFDRYKIVDEGRLAAAVARAFTGDALPWARHLALSSLLGERIGPRRERMLGHLLAEIDQHELIVVLKELAGQPGQMSGDVNRACTFYLPLAGDTCQVIVTYNERQITAVERGPGLTPEGWAELNRRAENSLRAGPRVVTFAQHWFPGYHSDVGGGKGIADGLARFSLWWMIREARACGLRFTNLDCSHHKYGNALEVIQRVDPAEKGVPSDYWTTKAGLGWDRLKRETQPAPEPTPKFSEMDTCAFCPTEMFDYFATIPGRRWLLKT